MIYKKKKTTKMPYKKKKMTKRPMSVAKLALSVKKLQSEQAGEKKRQTTFYQSNIGQVEANTDGIEVIDVTPIPLQGTQTNQRVGAQIRLHSSNYQFMIGQLPSTVTAVRYKITWLAVKGASYSSTTILTQFINNVYQPNPFLGGSIRDYNSQFNPDYFNTYKIIRQVKGIILPDQLSNTTVTKSFNVGLKYNKGQGHDVRFNQNLGGPDNIFNGQIIMVIQCDRGNASATTASTTTGIYDPQINTGLYLQYNKVDYYFDN